ncbi:hypothetical protein O6H91_19G034400 [Diphasiastrum complanatum]|uniref:Uncharacterized protein n=1 Tax=Diphasiastrum complanatum TaxID=34168 RepID=A0ACC2AU26_DIPCM|nr:hypothetical protein O6H91_19G034400 [Diphasiastrum complanatum]
MGYCATPIVIAISCFALLLEHAYSSRASAFSKWTNVVELVDSNDNDTEAHHVGGGVLKIQGFGNSVRSKPALYVFGDSIVDSGNNNYLNTISRADYLPYGKDFDTHQPTGRFSNGRLVPDFLAAYMGITFPSPYLASNTNIQQGANFGSAGSGILDSTGSALGSIMPFSQQVQYFQDMKQRLQHNIGEARANELISNAIIYISNAHNDIANNYYLPNSMAQQEGLSIEQFENLLISDLSKHIEVLHNEGARKFVIEALLPLGCAPAFSRISSSCAENLVEAASKYNNLLRALLAKQRRTFIDAHFLLANSFDPFYAIAQNPQYYGFVTSTEPCCNTQGVLGASVACPRGASTCQNDSEYVFWDMLHPTSKIYSILASKYWSGTPSNISPINIRQLVSL